ncbi:MAG: winged helix-turn-helix transcriptional regulator [Akkermansiaceae bacterium]|nr:winged helix-turn-helix transcriptional regulator [Akkermansiaceae bacterium]
MPSVVELNKALADRTRWRIVRMAMNEPLCVCELADVLGMPQSSVSSHVQIIRKAGLLESEKAEKWTYFRVRSTYLKLLLKMVELFPDGAKECQEDEARLESRLAQRRDSCCPGPKLLKSRKTSTTTTKP